MSVPTGRDVIDDDTDPDSVLITLVDRVCHAIETDDFEAADTDAKRLDAAVRERLDTLSGREPVPANLLSILQYVSDRQQYAQALSSSKKRDVVKAIREHRRGADGVSSYLDHAR